jgi:hypothetical protein
MGVLLVTFVLVPNAHMRFVARFTPEVPVISNQIIFKFEIFLHAIIGIWTIQNPTPSSKFKCNYYSLKRPGVDTPLPGILK